MSIPKKPFKLTRNLFRRIRKLYDGAVKALANWLLRGLRRIGKRPHWKNAGFALPTTIMVLLVVTLVTTALVIRSFDRNRNAVLSRSEQVIQNTSTPALDRARAKLTALLADPQLPRGTPPDSKLLEVMGDSKYTFGDETRLKLAFDLNEDGSIQTAPPPTTNSTYFDPKTEETLNTAWKYPVDTDGNGKFDAFTIYGLYWRSPNPDNNRTKREPLEARSLPQASAGASQACQSAQTAATLVQKGDWISQGGNLSKAFYVYAATVPITNTNQISTVPFRAAQFENNTKGDKAFSGLEYETDRYRSGLNNTAIWYQDDLVINPGNNFRVNGRVFTNSNLLVGPASTGSFRFFQVSSDESCFYEKSNAQINIAGNVGTGDVAQDTDQTAQAPVTVDLFQGDNINPTQTTIDGSNRSTDKAGGNLIAFNSAAYERRISVMNQAAQALCSGCSDQQPPTQATVNATYSDKDLQESFKDALASNGSGESNYKILKDQIEIYLRNRTRRVPFAEISAPDGTGAETGFSGFTGGNIEPQQDWREPLQGGTNFVNTSGASVSLDLNKLPQNNPDNRNTPNSKEDLLGDRIAVGNNLPALWKKDTTGKWIGQNGEKQLYKDIGPNATWADGGDRYRTSQAQALENLGITDRDGFWEAAAALDPSKPSNNNTGGGGLRVITGAGIYVDGNKSDGTAVGAVFPREPYLPKTRLSFLPEPKWDTRFVDPTETDTSGAKILPSRILFNSQQPIIVWPDLMPMTGGKAPLAANKVDIDGNEVEDSRQKGDLLMRATAVYHYVTDSINVGEAPDQKPIACVSSYYDPTDSTTARNQAGLPDVSGGIDTTGDGRIDQPFGGGVLSPPQGSNAGKSNNGVVYNFPDRGGYDRELRRQARLVFPDGRIVNEPLSTALQHQLTNKLTLADYSAIDSAICALAILNGQAQRSAVILDGAIKESSFLDAREVKALDKITPKDPNYDDITKNYDLPLEERHPLEIRTTDIDLGLLAAKEYGTFDSDGDGQQETEYLLPNSGVLYASRGDALSDNSNPTDEALNPSDYRLDPTRRPNAIRLIDGLRLARGQGNAYDVHEKGLILATNLPAYVRGHFNLHLPSKRTTFTGGPEIEEFNTALASDWSNFYNRTETDQDGRFACRRGQPNCTGTGDQWRPATILADAVTLQSVNFQDGYRNQGDFDLINNVGSAAYIEYIDPTHFLTKTVAGSREGYGFFDNSFITTASWWNTSNNFPKSEFQSSYLLNGVTPVQRRANQVTAYPTEVCRAIPVSACTETESGGTARPTDWTLDGLDTSRPPKPKDERYARRVAFQHVGNKYFYDPDGYPVFQTPLTPASITNNALWFRTRASGGAPDSYSGKAVSNAPAQPAIFQPKYPSNYLAALRDKSQIPDLDWLRGFAAASPNQAVPLDPVNPITTVPVGTSPNPLTTGGQRTFPNQLTYVFNQQFNPSYYAAPNKLFTLPVDQKFLDFSKEEVIAAGQVPRTTELTGGGRMRIFSASGLNLSVSRPITLSGDAGSVFVFIVNGSLNVNGAGLTLKGVLPDNVYWLVSGPVNIKLSQFQGNILATQPISLDKGTSLEGRALSATNNGVVLSGAGFGGKVAANASKIIAPSGNHPRLIPVTQIQSPDGTPAANLDTGNTQTYGKYWLQQAGATNYNAAFVVGDSPPRPDETSAGLNNIVRLQENWNAGLNTPQKTLTIKGSFIQQKRSSFATGPFPGIRKDGQAPLLNSTDQNLSIFNANSSSSKAPSSTVNFNRYQIGNAGGATPYFDPPTRQWGFDVGLLSQQPDLFSQRFTQDISKVQNYYRQVGRDDPWIQTLLCAAEPTSPNDTQRVGGSGTNYNRYVVPDKERPNCQDVTKARIPYPANPQSSSS